MAEPTPLSTTDAVYESTSITGEAVVLDVRPASVLLRGAGAAIDVVANLLILWGLTSLVVAIGGSAIDQAMGRALLILGVVFCLVVVPMLFETLTGGRSPGKFAIGARIVRDDGGAIQLRHAFVRAALGLIELYATLGAIALMTGLLNERSKRLGDLLAGTHSQLERVPQPVHAVWGVPESLVGWASVADVAQLPDRLSRRISQFLGQADKLVPASRARAAESLAAEAVAYVSPVPHVSAEELLAGIAAVRRDREYAALMIERAHLEALEPVLAGNPHGFPDR